MKFCWIILSTIVLYICYASAENTVISGETHHVEKRYTVPETQQKRQEALDKLRAEIDAITEPPCIPQSPTAETKGVEEGEEAESEEAESDEGEGDYDEGDYEEGDYEEGDYEEGDYEEGDYDEGDYEEGDYEEGDYEEGDYDYDEKK